MYKPCVNPKYKKAKMSCWKCKVSEDYEISDSSHSDLAAYQQDWQLFRLSIRNNFKKASC